MAKRISVEEKTLEVLNSDLSKDWENSVVQGRECTFSESGPFTPIYMFFLPSTSPYPELYHLL